MTLPMDVSQQVVLGLWFCSISVILFLWDIKVCKYWNAFPEGPIRLRTVLKNLLILFTLFWSCVWSGVFGIKILCDLLDRLLWF